MIYRVETASSNALFGTAVAALLASAAQGQRSPYQTVTEGG